MEWLLAKALERIMGTAIRIEVRGRDGFLAHYVANKIEYRHEGWRGYWTVVYDEEAEPVVDNSSRTNRLLQGDTQ